MSAPLITIGVPLYRSARHLDTIARNVHAVERADVEILFSDCHCHDDALERIAARFPGDRRLRFLAARDGIGWVGNYNRLLGAATGKYFLWAPHDDDYPPGFLAPLVARLEADPGVIVAYPRVLLVDEDGRELAAAPDPALLLGEGEPWSPRAALRQLFFRPSFSLPFHGLIRRAPVLEAGLFLRAPVGSVWADVYWVYALGLLGRPSHAPEAFLRKRIHASSTSAAWGRPRLRDTASGWSVLLGYIRDFAPSRAAAAEAAALVTAWSLARAAASAPETWRLPWRGRAVARRLLARALSSPRGSLAS